MIAILVVLVNFSTVWADSSSVHRVTVNFNLGQSSITANQKVEQEVSAISLIDTVKVDSTLGIAIYSGADAYKFMNLLKSDSLNMDLSVRRGDTLECWLEELGATSEMFIRKEAIRYPINYGEEWRFAAADITSRKIKAVPVDSIIPEPIVPDTIIIPADSLEPEPEIPITLEPSFMSFGVGSHQTTFGRQVFLSFRLGNDRVAMEAVYGDPSFNEHERFCYGKDRMTKGWMVGSYFYLQPFEKINADVVLGWNWNALFTKDKSKTGEDFVCASVGVSYEAPITMISERLGLQVKALWEPGWHEVKSDGFKSSDWEFSHTSLTITLNYKVWVVK